MLLKSVLTSKVWKPAYKHKIASYTGVLQTKQFKINMKVL